MLWCSLSEAKVQVEERKEQQENLKENQQREDRKCYLTCYALTLKISLETLVLYFQIKKLIVIVENL